MTDQPFLTHFTVGSTSWQAFERLVSRLLVTEGFTSVSTIGRTGDGGADVLALKNGRRWLFQVKRVGSPVRSEVIARTVAAARTYDADVPVIVSKSSFTIGVQEQRQRLAAEGIQLQLWDVDSMARRIERVGDEPLAVREHERFVLRQYQSDAVDKIAGSWQDGPADSALVVLATGLGKTFVAGETIRRMSVLKADLKVLVLAHTNDLVYQLERSLWPFLRASQSSTVVNGIERPSWGDLPEFDLVVASRDTFAEAAERLVELPKFDLVVVDECHHLQSDTYDRLLEALGVGQMDGPFLVGLTATPWRPDGRPLDHYFDGPTVNIDLVQGLQLGFLANVDYRMFTDNVDWTRLRILKGDRFSPKAINRTLFIDQWDDAVVERTQEAWAELGGKARAIVFCGTVAHAERVAERINAIGFTSAAAIYSRSSTGQTMSPIERSRMLWDFADGRIGALCAVDVLNEGVDVPDVNLVVFQRVTHSRRIFVQQLGRGLRLADGKDKVVVLDFVSDIRRFAAGLELQRSLDSPGPRPGSPFRVDIRSTVQFRRANSPDNEGSNFLHEWLGDVSELEDLGEDVSVLRFPPLEHTPSS